MGQLCYRYTEGKKKWILAVPVQGEVAVDPAGAKAVLRGMPLLMSHVVRCSGDFRVQECVRVTDEDDNELARGLCNYGSATVKASAGAAAESIRNMVHVGEDEWEDDLDGPPECMHANNICITHVETLSRSFTSADFLGHASGYESTQSED
jgi:glutamate 5-kinase